MTIELTLLTAVAHQGREITAPRLRGLHLVVDDLDAVRRTLLEREVEVSDVDDLGGVLFAHFEDPDGNGWTLQQVPDEEPATPRDPHAWSLSDRTDTCAFPAIILTGTIL